MPVPPLDRADLKQDQSAKEQRFWEEHFPALVKLYPDQFVAVHNNDVVAARPTLLQLLDAFEERGLSRDDVWVKFLTTNPRQVLR
jgi:hypothetical protein